jgi:octaprenyl-diphosphate synthase
MTALAPLYQTIAQPMDQVRRIFDRQLRSDLPFINQLCDHITQFRGKMLRPALVLLTGQACGRLGREHIGLAAVVEMVHMATLVHDDVLDEADLRRRVATVNRMHGNEAAVLLGDYLIAHAFYLCNSLNLPFASERIGATTNTICEGELIQIHNRGNYQLTQQQYFDIIGRKTASLTQTCSILGAHYAGAPRHVVSAMQDYGYQVGLAFQVIDDVLDVVGQQAQTGKTLGRDLEKGKLTLPMIHYLATTDPSARALALALLGNGQPGRIRRLAEMLTDSDSVDYATRIAQGHIDSACRNLDVLAPSPARDALAAVADFVFHRQH